MTANVADGSDETQHGRNARAQHGSHATIYARAKKKKKNKPSLKIDANFLRTSAAATIIGSYGFTLLPAYIIPLDIH